jgi:hypothetical protein
MLSPWNVNIKSTESTYRIHVQERWSFLDVYLIETFEQKKMMCICRFHEGHAVKQGLCFVPLRMVRNSQMPLYYE